MTTTPTTRGGRRKKTLILVRHAESCMNAERVLHGRDFEREAPLSAAGRAQAEALGRRLRGIGFEAVVASELRRARETLEIIVRTVGEEMLILPPNASFNEMHYGELDGRTLRDVLPALKSVAAKWHEGDHHHPLPDGESPEQVVRRYVNELTSLMRRYDSVLVVSHALANKVMLASLSSSSGSSYGSKINAVPQDNACINEIVVYFDAENVSFEVIRVNDVEHLLRSGGSSRV